MAKLKVDIIAYQDEVGCVRDKFTLPRLKKNWQRMRDIHNRLNIEMWLTARPLLGRKEPMTASLL